jgi:uncharacterized protein with GYD domain
MLFVSLSKFRKKPTKEMLAQIQKLFGEVAKAGGKLIGHYWTLGRYDCVLIIEAPDEKTAMKGALKFADMISTETMVAVPAEEAFKLVE